MSRLGRAQPQPPTALSARLAALPAPGFQDIAGAVAGSSAVSATVTRIRAIGGTVNGTSAVSATVSRIRAVTASAVNGTSAVSATVTLYKTIAGSTAGTSAVAATVTVIRAVTAAINGATDFSATVTGGASTVIQTFSDRLRFWGHRHRR